MTESASSKEKLSAVRWDTSGLRGTCLTLLRVARGGCKAAAVPEITAVNTAKRQLNPRETLAAYATAVRIATYVTVAWIVNIAPEVATSVQIAMSASVVNAMKSVAWIAKTVQPLAASAVLSAAILAVNVIAPCVKTPAPGAVVKFAL